MFFVAVSIILDTFVVRYILKGRWQDRKQIRWRYFYTLTATYRHCTPVILLNGISTALGV